jgi:hypothetical protein
MAYRFINELTIYQLIKNKLDHRQFKANYSSLNVKGLRFLHQLLLIIFG